MGNIHPNPTLHPNLTTFGPQIRVSVTVMTSDFSYVFKKKYKYIMPFGMAGNNFQCHFGCKIMATSLLIIMGNIHPNDHPQSEPWMACYQRQYLTLSISIIQIRIKTNNSKLSYCDGHGGPNVISTRTSVHMRCQQNHSYGISRPFSPHHGMKRKFYCINAYFHVCISVVLMPMGFIFAVPLDGDKGNKLSEQDSMNEGY